MLHEVRVYKGHPDQGAKVARTISPDVLEQRSKTILAMDAGYGIGNRPPREVVCERCGVTFFAQNTLIKYCPDTCGRENRLLRGNKLPPREKTCVRCGESFLTQSPHQKYCGPICSSEVKREAERARSRTRRRNKKEG
ncbi:MAG: hypothetical protein GWM98_11680 [Nitrospinaceae bacterium]|nr:hypothetical protein [Nitrospinaceae bacterium]NIR55044.1 hypothetical protein [Nitrospinaceae bacterium]NIS85443.1 hypothetical protein [Nitrospinaceae bacterium]NIT82282.1 hypothetical protein [Nitrospinaceae bacterium]NIU44513.1 hypothetical protein [Nitrospinaceae bacterium]